MIRDFVSLAGGAPHNVGMVRHVLADHKKRRFDVMSGQQIEQFRGELLARAIVKSHRDVRSIDMNPVERDARLGRREAAALGVSAGGAIF